MVGNTKTLTSTTKAPQMRKQPPKKPEYEKITLYYENQSKFTGAS